MGSLEFFPTIHSTRQRLLKLLELQETPLFVCDPSIISARVAEAHSALERLWGDHAIAYSYKTNPEVTRLPQFQTLLPWVEVVSEFEYDSVLTLGYDPGKIVVNGPHKPESLLRKAIRNGSLLHLHHLAEVKAFLSLPATVRKKAKVGLRLNCDLSELPSRFGISVENGDAERVLRQLQRAGVAVTSLHVHLGSDVYDEKVYAAAGRTVNSFITANPKYFTQLKYLDCGGGYHSHSLPPLHAQNWKEERLEDFLTAFITHLKPTNWSTQPMFIIEPGRFIVDDAIFLMTKVIDVTQSNRHSSTSNHQSVIVDSTINMLPTTWYRPNIVRAFSPPLTARTAPKLPTIIYGCSCQETDTLFSGELSSLKVGDIVIFFCVGAYNQNMAPNFIFSRPEMTVL